jgi:hypothetical protein
VEWAQDGLGLGRRRLLKPDPECTYLYHLAKEPSQAQNNSDTPSDMIDKDAPVYNIGFFVRAELAKERSKVLVSIQDLIRAFENID